jgi:hypothetical protein
VSFRLEKKSSAVLTCVLGLPPSADLPCVSSNSVSLWRTKGRRQVRLCTPLGSCRSRRHTCGVDALVATKGRSGQHEALHHLQRIAPQQKIAKHGLDDGSADPYSFVVPWHDELNARDAHHCEDVDPSAMGSSLGSPVSTVQGSTCRRWRAAAARDTIV